MSARKLWQIVIATSVSALVSWGCSGESFNGDRTIISGLIVLPSPQNCADCDNASAPTRLLALQQGAMQQEVTSVRTSARGVYSVTLESDEQSQIASDSNGDGQQTFIIVTTLNDVGAQIGGVLSARLGASLSKDFNPTTHVACIASVLLTAGTASANDPGCVVRAACGVDDGPGCRGALDPDVIDDGRIDVLEAASSYISADVTFPDNSSSAACAVIECTDAGAHTTTEECVRSAFEGRSFDL